MHRRLVRALLVLAGVFGFGTVGYALIEGASPWESFYMTVITLTTVGYGEVFPLSRAGEVFTVVLLLFGLGLLLLGVTEAARWALEGELRRYFERARRTRMIERLTDHEIVCGWGRMGGAVVEELSREGRAFVVVEDDAAKIERLHALQIPVREGDATSEQVLRAAGVERARGLVACLTDDAHNVYTVLAARSLNARLFIVARATDESAERRMVAAGANRVVNPYRIGGARLAHLLVKPAVVDLLGSVSGPGGQELQLEQVRLTADSPLVGKSISAAELERRWSLSAVAIQRGAVLNPNPAFDLVLADSDLLIVLGQRPHLDRFEREVCVSKGR